jgi:hypothetical protein
MKKKFTIWFLLAMILTTIIIFAVPSQAFADTYNFSGLGGNFLINVETGYAGSNTEIEFIGSEDMQYYTVFVHLYTLPGNVTLVDTNFFLNSSNSFRNSINTVLDAGEYGLNVRWYDAMDETYYFSVYNKSASAKPGPEPYVEPVPFRTHEMTCYQVWINEDNNFEFVFFWEYANNNWVKIYDMAGVEVFSIDMEKGHAHFTAALPDGMYTVKTFHDGFKTPIQEFVIGKP